MATVTGPISTLPGFVREAPRNESCDDCTVELCNRLQEECESKQVDAGGGLSIRCWLDVPELKAKYETEKAKLPHATRRVQGETDSFGSEQRDLCDACYWKHAQEAAVWLREEGWCE